jgi:hypothetical protein
MFADSPANFEPTSGQHNAGVISGDTTAAATTNPSQRGGSVTSGGRGGGGTNAGLNNDNMVGKRYCHICNEHYDFTQFSKHLKRIKHIRNASSPSTGSNGNANNEGKRYCSVCHIYVKRLDEHEKSGKHKIAQGVNSEFVHCDVCNVNIRRGNFAKHENSSTHRVKYLNSNSQIAYNPNVTSVLNASSMTDRDILENTRFNPSCDSIKIERLFQKYGYTIKLKTGDFDLTHMPQIFLDYHRNNVRSILQNFRNRYKQFKVFFVLKLAFSKLLTDIGENVDDEYQLVFIRSRFQQLNFLNDLDEFIFSLENEIFDQIERSENIEGSGLCFDHVEELEINIVPIDLIHSTTGSNYIPTPEFLKSRNAILNIENLDDNKCLKYCILAALYPDLPHRTKPATYYHLLNVLNFSGISSDFVTVSEFDKIERQNNVRLNAFILQNEDIYPLRVSTSSNELAVEIDLLLLCQESDDCIKYHWTLIKSLERLLFHKRSNPNNKKFFLCKRCLTHFSFDKTRM